MSITDSIVIFIVIDVLPHEMAVITAVTGLSVLLTLLLADDDVCFCAGVVGYSSDDETSLPPPNVTD